MVAVKLTVSAEESSLDAVWIGVEGALLDKPLIAIAVFTVRTLSFTTRVPPVRRLLPPVLGVGLTLTVEEFGSAESFGKVNCTVLIVKL